MSAHKTYRNLSSNAREALIYEHSSLVKRIAYHLIASLPQTVQINDLIQAGMVGLLEAINNYDATRGASFETYAGIRIRGAIIDELRKGDWTPRSVHRKVREVAGAVHRIEAVKQQAATDEEVAKELDMPLDEYYKITRDAVSCHLLLHDLGSDASEENYISRGVDDNPEESYRKEGFQVALAEEMGGLPEKEKLMLSLYYDEGLNLKEISAVFGVGESRVSQIHGQAIIRLRSRLQDWL